MSGASFDAELTIAQALEFISKSLDDAGIEEPKREARLLLRLAMGISLGDLIAKPGLPLGESHARVAQFVEARCRHAPLSRILGTREFFGLDFELSPETLDPRPETELLVETALDFYNVYVRPVRPFRICDIGTGTGAILIALLVAIPEARGFGIDIAMDAVATAHRNARRHGVDDRVIIWGGNLLEGISETFDIIVSNPPYIPTGDLPDLPPEVRDFDPPRALDGGLSGLDFYHRIAMQAALRLNPRGMLALEVGAGQAQQVSAILARAGYGDLAIRRDLAGIERVVSGLCP